MVASWPRVPIAINIHKGYPAMTDTHFTSPEGTKTHPFVATILMDPAKLYSFERAIEDGREVKILKVDDLTPSAGRAACASEEVQDLLESNW
jgi:hypothetical protein